MSIRLIMVAVVATSWCAAQPLMFSSGSTGADGPLNYPTPGTYYFNPTALGINSSRNNIFNFTTINIASGVTLILTSKILTGPVYWLASDDVTISGSIVLDGENGVYAGLTNASDRIPTAGGPGGFGGGMGGGSGLTATPGNGPGGGAANGLFTGNQYLIPLIGGSGGGGAPNGNCYGLAYGGPGGAGGGAILIASSTTITLIGPSSGSQPRISARGGNASCGGGTGAGGAIRLVANTINATCAPYCPGIDVSSQGDVADGWVRVESFAGNFAPGGTVNIFGNLASSVPFALALPATAPSVIKVTSINGIPINANPFTFPDVLINTTSAVNVNVQAQYIPIGTIPKIHVFGESGPDQTISCSALAGTLQQSTCTASIPFVTGGSRGFVKATW